MNKKIKIIDLLNKIANGEEVPKRIKLDNFNILNEEVEILEDNTEEIEELTLGDLANIDGMANDRIMNKFNKLVKAVNKMKEGKE